MVVAHIESYNKKTDFIFHIFFYIFQRIDNVFILRSASLENYKLFKKYVNSYFVNVVINTQTANTIFTSKFGTISLDWDEQNKIMVNETANRDSRCLSCASSYIQLADVCYYQSHLNMLVFDTALT